MKVPILRLGRILLASIQVELSDSDALQFQSDLVRRVADIEALGVALALALVEPALQRLRFAAVGNVRAVLLHDAQEYRLGSARGIVGAGYTGLAPETLALDAGDSLFLYSDGFDELLPLRELLRPAVTAQAVAESALQRWAKANDDASMLVYLGSGARTRLN